MKKDKRHNSPLFHLKKQTECIFKMNRMFYSFVDDLLKEIQKKNWYCIFLCWRKLNTHLRPTLWRNWNWIFFKFITRQRQCRKSDRGLWKIQLLYFGACVFFASLTYKFLEIKQTMHERPAARTYIFQGSSKIKLLYRLRNISISSIVCLTVVHSKWRLITSHTIYSIFATIYCKINQCICI